MIRTQSGALCIDPRTLGSATDQERDLPVCSAEILAESAPLTPGRDLGPPTLWNTWAEARYVDVSDERYGLEMDTTLASATFGIDRRVGKDAALGVSFALDDSDTGGFNDFLKVGATGFNIGPYAALRLSDHWVANASLTYGLYDTDVELVVLNGDYTAQVYGSALDFYGQYTAGEYFIRPKLTINYSHIINDGFDLSGTIFNRDIAVRFDDDSFDYGRLEAKTEFSRLFTFSNGTVMMPFVEVGALYEFERPNDGQILTGDLSLVTPSPWAGTLRAGVRLATRNALQLEATAGYLSFGQNDLDAWEGKLRLSYGF